MLNAKALSDLLSRNSDERLCKRWWIMTPNGTLLASTRPSDPKDLRKKVATYALAWQEYQQPANLEPNGQPEQEAPSSKHALHTLIVELESSNFLVQRIQPDLLLVLEGGVPPRKKTFEPRTTAEGPDGEQLHSTSRAESTLGTSLLSKAESSRSAVSAGSVLGLHRRKLDAMAAAISSDFAQTGFKMPEESINNYF